MYEPAHFQQQDPAALHALMAEFPLATLVHQGSKGLCADAIPLMLDRSGGEPGVLIGHVSRANPLWREAADHAVLAVFHGPQGYLSPSWYPSKAAHHKVVPTWNYAWVQAEGILRVVDDAAGLHDIVSRLTRRHEEPRPAPWAVTDAPPAFVQQMLGAIVGIRIEVTALRGKWKLSQNRSSEDHAGAVSGVAAQPDEASQQLAHWMARAKS